ncbi:outer membrane beta-barrel protein [Chryseobacterium paridis]|uniref:Outer membrane beta-barrel protein n=1 Tax=Chryseobacterium paridis TaxID=2800328 RepID=A0ABS1FQE8_9FLAO|nr:outer membrane beta-barrel protein [Chryseobacterium paridis]MBK1894655.1 outer membrane beta-barrel protein [Chryseobacterium paridis]
MNNQWLNDLRRKMEDHTDDVPDGLWDNIKGEIFEENEENNVVGLPIEKESEKEKQSSVRRIRPLVYRIAGIAAAVALFFVIGKQLLDVNNTIEPGKSKSVTRENDQLSDASTPSINKKTNSGSDQNVSGKITSDEPVVLSQRSLSGSTYNKGKENSITYGNRYLNDKAMELFVGLKGKNAPIIQNKIPSIEDGNRSINRNDEIDRLISETDIGLQNKSIATTVKEKKQKAKKSWMLSLLTGKASSNSQQFPGYTTISGEPLRYDQAFSASSYEDDPFMQVLVANQSQNVEATVRHKVPLNLGISLYYNLGKRWGIGTGVNYTKLSSELHSGSQSNYVKSEQTVHYIGIPVQVNYNVIQKGKFTGYVTGGALVEKSVAGTFKTKYIVDNVVNDETKERLPSQPVQVSLNTALGLQLKLVDKIGVYAEPGVGYHFKNDGSLNTIYKEKPFNVNIKFGIRVLLD